MDSKDKTILDRLGQGMKVWWAISELGFGGISGLPTDNLYNCEGCEYNLNFVLDFYCCEEQ